MSESVARDSIVKLRPHYSLRGNEIYFLASTRPIKNCNDSEAALFRRLAQAPDGILLSTFPKDELPQLKLIINARFADIVESLKPTSDRHLVVIEPHMDDAILSAGGQLLLRKGKQRITILSVFGLSNYTSYIELKRPFFDHEEITRLRTAESILAASKVGAQFCSLNLYDAPLRLLSHDQWTESGLSEQVRMTRSFLGSYPIPHVVHEVALELGHVLEDLNPDELWMPMGLGHHVDHRTCRSACLEALVAAKGKLSQIPVRLYEDLPYSQETHRKQIIDTFRSAGANLVLQTEDTSDVMDEKLLATGVFASQFKLPAMAPRLMNAASEVAKEAGYQRAGERYYLLERPFKIPQETKLAIDRDSLLELRSDLENFAAKISHQKRINILVLPSGVFGSMPEVVAALSAVFPSTNVMINVIAANHQETSVHQLMEVSVKYIPEASWHVKLLLAMEFGNIGIPTIIVLWGAKQGSLAKRAILKMLNISRPLLVVSSLSDLCALWEEIEQGGQNDKKPLLANVARA